MEAFRTLADQYDLFLIEDAAQALGSTRFGRQAGSFGDLAAFSFHETKNVICGEGGALIINNDALKERAEIIREKGTNRSQFYRGQVDKYSWVDIGSSYLPGELIAAFLYAQLSCEGDICAQRRALWTTYDNALREFTAAYGVSCPARVAECEHNGHMYYLLFPNLETREAFIAYMKAALISTPFHYVPLHSAPAGQRYCRTSGSMAQTNRISDTLVRLPMFYSLRDQRQIIDTTKEALQAIFADHSHS